jgi:endonuclease/exonuclease/phosphatase family metal-dependent hydrolase
VRLVLYNMRYAAGHGLDFHTPFPGAGYLRDAGTNLGRIQHFLHGLDADVLALIEIDSGSRRAPDSQVTTLATALGTGHHAFRCKYSMGSLAARLPLLRAQGNAVLSRAPLNAVRYHDLSRGTKRLVIEAELDGANLFVVHLSVRPAQRRHQLLELADLVRASSKPAVIAGDLNTLQPARELKHFLHATGLRPADATMPASWPVRRPRLALDHVLVPRELKVTGFEVHDVRLSDHRPLVCDLQAA